MIQKAVRRLAVWAGVTVSCLGLAGCGGMDGYKAGGAVVKAPRPDGVLHLSPARFDDLPGWQSDDQALALPALHRSCNAMMKRAAHKDFGASPHAGTVADWQPICRALVRLLAHGQPSNDDARLFLTSWFQPWQVSDEGDPDGLFTGYYEASARGHWRRQGPYQTPIYALPAKRHRRHERAAIADGVLDGKADVLVYLDDPVDAFFLEVQGSGQIQLRDGGSIRVGYAGQNGHPYTAIGKVLRERGEIERPVTMAKIRAWLNAHADQAQEVMNQNQSYVFFRRLKGEPEGAQGVALTVGRSMAVDRRYLPLGVPLWLNADGPSGDIKRLVIAQDTGGAIKGVVRGDLFWGPGEEAAAAAGAMQGAGRVWMLLPAQLQPE